MAWSPAGCDFALTAPEQAGTQKLILDPKRAQAFTLRGLLAPKIIYGIKTNHIKVSCLVYKTRLSLKQLQEDFQKQLEINSKEKGIKDWRANGLSALGSGTQQGRRFHIAIYYGPASQLVLIGGNNKAAFDQMRATVRLKR